MVKIKVTKRQKSHENYAYLTPDARSLCAVCGNRSAFCALTFSDFFYSRHRRSDARMDVCDRAQNKTASSSEAIHSEAIAKGRLYINLNNLASAP